jgi:hypothetical protein
MLYRLLGLVSIAAFALSCREEPPSSAEAQSGMVGENKSKYDDKFLEKGNDLKLYLLEDPLASSKELVVKREGGQAQKIKFRVSAKKMLYPFEWIDNGRTRSAPGFRGELSNGLSDGIFSFASDARIRGMLDHDFGSLQNKLELEFLERILLGPNGEPSFQSVSQGLRKGKLTITPGPTVMVSASLGDGDASKPSIDYFNKILITGPKENLKVEYFEPPRIEPLPKETFNP